MSVGQSYIIRVLRNVETWLGENRHAAEGAKVGKIIQRIAQAESVDEALGELHRVEGFRDFSLHLMWMLQRAQQPGFAATEQIVNHHAALLTSLLTTESEPEGEQDVVEQPTLPATIDKLYLSLHKFGRSMDAMKRGALVDGMFHGIDEESIYVLLNSLAELGESASSSGRKDALQFTEACTGFVHYAVEKSLLQDVRVLNVLDNANCTLQTVFEAGGGEDHDSLQSTIDLLKQPNELLN
jgi:hypothetical protein